MADIPPDMPITVTDIREAGHCGRMRGFFRQYGLEAEFREMTKGGSITAAKMLATGDARAIGVVKRVAKREGLLDG